MKYIPVSTLGFALVALTVSACGGSTGTAMAPTPAPSATSQVPLGGCAAVLTPQVQLLYPQPGATGIPSPNLHIYVGSVANPSPPFNPPVLTAANGSTITGTAFAPPSPEPTPMGSATPQPNDQEFVSAFSTLASATTYTVTLSTACSGTMTLGSFTTQ